MSTGNQLFLDQIKTEILRFLTQLERHNPKFMKFVCSRPAGSDEIDRVNKQLGFPLPQCLQQLFGLVSSNLEMFWALNDKPELPLSMDFATGYVCWNIDRVASIVAIKRKTETGTVLEAYWSDKFPFVDFGNGDYLAVSTDTQEEAQVYYLTPADPPECAVSFSSDLFEFLAAWVSVGCVCEESLLQLRGSTTGKLDKNTVAWNSWNR